MNARTTADCVAEAKALIERLEGFTPGPWRAEEQEISYPECSDHDYPWFVLAVGDKAIVELWNERDEDEANARLTAAAPDMHRTILDLLAVIERHRAALRPFAVLAEAYDPVENDDDEPCWVQEFSPTLGDLRRARAALGEKP